MLAVVLTVRFLMEIALLAVLGWWGIAQAPGLAGIALAVVVVVGAAALWGLVVAPRARLDVPPAVRVATEVVLVLLGAGALVDLGYGPWGALLLVIDVAGIIALGAIGARAGVGWSPHDVQRGMQPGRGPASH